MIMTIATTKIIWTIIKTILMAIIIKTIIITITITIKIVTDKADIKIVAKVSGKITITENKIITEENAVYSIFLDFAVGKKNGSLKNDYLYINPLTFHLSGVFLCLKFIKCENNLFCNIFLCYTLFKE